MAEPPSSLKQVLPFVKHANQLAPHEPLMAYYCTHRATPFVFVGFHTIIPIFTLDTGRYYAIKRGLELKEQAPQSERGAIDKYLGSIMVSLESDHGKLANRLNAPGNQKDFVENFALKVFNLADQEDRAGRASKYVRPLILISRMRSRFRFSNL